MRFFRVAPSIESAFERPTSRNAILIAVILFFFLAVLPIASSFVFYAPHPQRRYTDAAIMMLRNHEWLTPREGDNGSPRLAKPILTYWLLIASYKAFGMSPFSSRIVFLLTACATIWVAYSLARRVTGDRRIGQLAAIILLSQPILILAAINSMPDAVLGLAILVSAYGFIRLVCLRESNSTAYWLAYGGIAMAIAAKGLLGFAFLGYVLIFARLSFGNFGSLVRLWHWKSVAFAAAVTFFWIALMAWGNGQDFFHAFWGDQIGKKIEPSAATRVLRTAGYFFFYVLTFLPWILALGFLIFKGKAAAPLNKECRSMVLFTVFWASLLPVIFGSSDRLNMHYLIAAMPLVAVTLATQLLRFSPVDLGSAMNFMLNLIAPIFVAIAIFGLALLWQTHLLARDGACIAILFLSTLFLLLWICHGRFSAPARFSLGCLLLLPLATMIGAPFQWPEESAQMATALRQIDPDRAPIVFVGPSGLSSKLRMSTGGKIPIYQFDHLSDVPSGAIDERTAILSETEEQKLSANSYRVQNIASGSGGISLPELVRAVLHGSAKSYFDSRKVSYYAAVPSKSPQ
jgi:4-amino-4-deoxy-L-arabinose transferase-like glycosyltransferase